MLIAIDSKYIQPLFLQIYTEISKYIKNMTFKDTENKN